MMDSRPAWRNSTVRVEMKRHATRVIDRMDQQRMHTEDVTGSTRCLHNCSYSAASKRLVDDGPYTAMVAHAPLA